MNSIEMQYPYFISNVFPINKVVIADIISKIHFDYYLCRYMLTLIVGVGGMIWLQTGATHYHANRESLVPFCDRDGYQALTVMPHRNTP